MIRTDTYGIANMRLDELLGSIDAATRLQERPTDPRRPARDALKMHSVEMFEAAYARASKRLAGQITYGSAPHLVATVVGFAADGAHTYANIGQGILSSPIIGGFMASQFPGVSTESLTALLRDLVAQLPVGETTAGLTRVVEDVMQVVDRSDRMLDELVVQGNATGSMASVLKTPLLKAQLYAKVHGSFDAYELKTRATLAKSPAAVQEMREFDCVPAVRRVVEKKSALEFALFGLRRDDVVDVAVGYVKDAQVFATTLLEELTVLQRKEFNALRRAYHGANT